MLELTLLFFAGLVSGVVNSMAGGGSFLTLPALMAFGLSPSVANATNRVGTVVQSLVGSVEFWRQGDVDWRLLRRLTPICVLGATLGSWLASSLGAAQFERAFGLLLVVMSLVLFSKDRWLRSGPKRQASAKLASASVWLQVAFLGVGLFGGFIQAGVGILIITACVLLARTDVVTANAIKLPLVLAFTLPALVVFMVKSQVAWLPGLVLSAGNALGAVLGVRVALRVAPRKLLSVVALAALATGLVLLVP